MDALTPPANPAIPIVDVRDGGPLRHATDYATSARALRDECLRAFLPGTVMMMPALDDLSRRWLSRSASPYVEEVATIADTLGFSGVWALNGSYQWCCTAVAREERGTPWLARTLDWPFGGLGRHVAVARSRGPAGEFFNVTWPGFVGVLTAMAPGRFAACINQAPMRRRTRLPWLRLTDFVANAIATWSIRHDPPDHLLRQAFETCRNYADARVLLETTPVARPVIFTLVGCASGERCVIERTEEGCVTRVDDTVASNDWVPCRSGWEARMPIGKLLTRSCADAADMNRVRHQQIADCTAVSRGFDWVTPTVLNPYTRIAVTTAPATGELRVLGYERDSGERFPRPVTAVCAITPAPA